MRGKSHVRFGGRARETGRSKGRHRALVRPNWYVLEEREFELLLVNARTSRTCRAARPTSPTRRGAQLFEHGLLRPSFVPPTARSASCAT